jgi:hypothetical protein
MKVPVLLHPIVGAGFRAEGMPPFQGQAEGKTREEALAALKSQILAQLENGTEITYLEIDRPANPWDKVIGMYDDVPDSEFDEYLKAIEEYRNEVEADPNR